MGISVCIICFNEERNIRRCIESVRWAQEIVVVDSLSRDRTVELVRQYPVQIYQRQWAGYVNQKNYALSMAHEDWILSMDADEEVSEPLRDEILGVVGQGETEKGYRIPRRSFFQGRWMSHCGFYPDMQLRLFKRGFGTWVGGRLHERVEVKGGIGDLQNDLLHYPYKGTIAGLLHTVNTYSDLYAEEMYEKGKHYHVGKLFFRPLYKFLEIYFIRLGMMDGLPGFVIAMIFAYGMFIRYLKLREIEEDFHHRLKDSD